MFTADAGLTYLEGTGLELADPADDLRGMVVVDPYGYRLGTVDDLVVDIGTRRSRLLSVVSGGILGLAPREVLVAVEMITKIDERIHVTSLGPAIADWHRPPIRSYRPS
jgi:sporulation protein YlmC with PRC-barrel domain